MVNKAVISGLDSKAREYALFVSSWEKMVIPSKITTIPTDRLEELSKLLEEKTAGFWEDVEDAVYDLVDVSFSLSPQLDALYRLTYDISGRLSDLGKAVSEELLRREKIEAEKMEEELRKTYEEHARLMREYEEWSLE